MKRGRLKVDPAKIREWQQRSRKALPRESRKKRIENRAKPDIREAVFARDGWRCVMPDRVAAYLRDTKANGDAGRCFGPLTPHHIRKEGQGGEYTMANLVSLCSFHNDWCEDHPAFAHALGLVRRAGE